MKLRQQIVFPIFTTLFFGLALTFLVLFLIIKSSLAREYLQHLETATELKGISIQTFLNTIETKSKNGSNVAHELIFTDKHLPNSKTFESKITKFLTGNEEFLGITIYDTNNNILFKKSKNFDYSAEYEAKKQTFIENMNDEGLIISDIISTKKISKDNIEYKTKTIPSTKKIRRFFSEFLHKDGTHVHTTKPLTINPISTDKVMFVGIFHNDEHPLKLIFEISPKSLYGVLEDRFGLGESGETYLVGADFFMRSNSRFSEESTIFRQKVVTKNTSECFSEKDFFERTKPFPDYRNVLVIGTHRYIPQMEWCLVSEIDADEAFFAAQEIAQLLFFIFILLSTITYVIIRIISKKITDPIVELQNIAQKISTGNLKTKIPTIIQKNEIGELACNFEIMLKALQNTDKKIAKKVTEQTNEIKLQKEKAEQLAVDLRQFKICVDQAVDYICISDEKGLVTYVNKSMEENTGFKTSEVIGKSVMATFNSEEDPKIINFIISEMEKNKKPMIMDLIISRKNQTTFPANVHLSPVINSHGKLKYIIGIVRDMTKQAEVDRLKNEFISIVSHDLRTPMTVIRGYIKLFLENKLGRTTEKQQRILNRIRLNTVRLIALVNDMLDISKLEANRMDFQKEKFCMSEMTIETVQDFENIINEKNIKFCVKYKEGRCVKTDKARIKQVITNIIGNALKFTPIGGNIDVTVTDFAKDKNYIFVSVKDSGIGINEAAQKQIFEKFSQIKGHLQRHDEGTGLGLAIAKMIIEKIGGKIWVNSAQTKGAEFCFIMKKCTDKNNDTDNNFHEYYPKEITKN